MSEDTEGESSPVMELAHVTAVDRTASLPMHAVHSLGFFSFFFFLWASV